MKREEARSAYYEFSGKLSEVARQLSFAGIAVVWLFHVDAKRGPQIDERLWQAITLIVISLACDFAQYGYQTAAWGILNRIQEHRGVTADADFVAPAWLNWPGLLFFWAKVLAVGLAYVYLLCSVTKRFIVVT
jgi:hypothetical protein